MPAYLIVETDIHDPERYERYKEASPGAIAEVPIEISSIQKMGDLKIDAGAFAHRP